MLGKKIIVKALKINCDFIKNCRVYSYYIPKDAPKPLRSRKEKSQRQMGIAFQDIRRIQAIGGKGGNGCISFLSTLGNEFAGPDGGDGGNGGHVILQACSNTFGLQHLETILRGEIGEQGGTDKCHGKCADHTVIKVPVGTVIKTANCKVVGDLEEEGSLFILARGGAGGRGNSFFTSATNQSPSVAELGANGETISYTLELRSMANFGLLGFPNAGKSTLLQAISRARPKIAPYPFTTLTPQLGIVKYDDYEQLSIADLPGIIEGSHVNKGLGIQFLRHVERCTATVIVVDASLDEPWKYVEKLRYELEKFNKELASRPQVILANKIDVPEAQENIEEMKKSLNKDEIIPISAKHGTNLTYLLQRLRMIYDSCKTKSEETD